MISGVGFDFGLGVGDCARSWLASKNDVEMSATARSLIKRKRFLDFAPDDKCGLAGVALWKHDALWLGIEGREQLRNESALD
jgi:hypothetical protein